MTVLSIEFVRATNSDVPRLPHLLATCPQHVFVRNFSLNDQLPLVYYVKMSSKHIVIEEDGHFVLHGEDARKEGCYASFRIVETKAGHHVLEWRDNIFLDWGLSPPVFEILIPKPI